MALADTSINPRILDSARAEFLAKGYLNASLREICANAGVTTGALYTRYSGKEELFCALLRDALDDIDATVAAMDIDLAGSCLSDRELYDMWSMTEDSLGRWFLLLQTHREAFTLLVRCSEGSSFQNYQHDLVEKVCKQTYRRYLVARDRGLVRDDITARELHVMTTAFMGTVFEPFIHDFSDEEIRLHCRLTPQFLNWHRLLGFELPSA